ncbi:MAG: GNAT family N-acetyltransferase [Nocardioidaceae bacterium]
MIEVRPPRPDDVDRLAEINLQSWRAAYAGIVPQGFLDAMDARQYEQKWRDRLADPSKPTMCVAVIDGVVSSYAVGGPYRQQQDAPPGDVTGPQLGEIYAIYSHPQMWGRGAGLAVHETMLATLAVAGYTELALWVLQANDASRRWYSRRGWKPDGVTSQWEGAGAPLTEIRLRHPLSPPR